MSRRDEKRTNALSDAFQTVRKRGARFAGVSLAATVISQLILFGAILLLGDATEERSQTVWAAANIFAVIVTGIPSFYLNRHWVWENGKGKVDVMKEALPFWGFAFAGLLLSTFTVALVANLFSNPLAANAANLTAFGVLWLFKLIVFEKKVFGNRTRE